MGGFSFSNSHILSFSNYLVSIFSFLNNNPNINCPNANWNGVTTNYCNGTASDDVVAHEWGHAYTDGTNDLIYAFESGALNEAYSDIWGETVDLLILAYFFLSLSISPSLKFAFS